MTQSEESLDQALGAVRALRPVLTEVAAINAHAQARDYAAVQARSYLLHEHITSVLLATVAAHPLDAAA